MTGKNTTMADFPFAQNAKMNILTLSIGGIMHSLSAVQDVGQRSGFRIQKEKVLVKGYEAIVKASDLLQQGSIFAIKGFGGFHIACNARKEEPVKELRRRLRRPEQPFAVMAKNAGVVETFTELEGPGREYLTSYRCPITVLPRAKQFNLAESVPPGLHNIGVMLPYTATQNLLFDRVPDAVYVMTSANLPGRPMVVENKEALEKLKGIADFFLLHNRVIANPER